MGPGGVLSDGAGRGRGDMASICSLSTDAELVAFYMGNGGCREDAGVSTAAEFATAFRVILRCGLARVEFAGETMEFGPRVPRKLADAIDTPLRRPEVSCAKAPAPRDELTSGSNERRGGWSGSSQRKQEFRSIDAGTPTLGPSIAA